MKIRNTEITVRTGVEKSLMVTLIVSLMLLFAGIGVARAAVGKWKTNESPRRKQRGITLDNIYFFAASGGELIPK